MVNRSLTCTNTLCKKNAVEPIYYRDMNRVFRVAFYVCRRCMHFSGFVNWTTHRMMPYFYHIGSEIPMRLVKRQEGKRGEARMLYIREMKKDFSKPCIECNTNDYAKLYLRKRPSFQYVGYICKKCKVAYFVNTKDFKLRTEQQAGLYPQHKLRPRPRRIPPNEYLGTFYTHLGEDQEKEEYEKLHMLIKKKDIQKLKRALKKSHIELKASSNLFLTPLKLPSDSIG